VVLTRHILVRTVNLIGVYILPQEQNMSVKNAIRGLVHRLGPRYCIVGRKISLREFVYYAVLERVSPVQVSPHGVHIKMDMSVKVVLILR
jgi:hypothetical protein